MDPNYFSSSDDEIVEYSTTPAKRITKAASQREKKVQKQQQRTLMDSMKIKMLIDMSKLETALKDCIEKEFVDISMDIVPEDKRGYLAKKCSIQGLIRWTHMSTNELVQSTSAVPVAAVEPFALLVQDSDQFLSLLLQSADGVDFDQLDAHIAGIQGTLLSEGLCPRGTGLTLVLLDLDKAVNKLQRKLTKQSGATGAVRSVSSLVDSATAYLLYSMGVEVTRWARPAELMDHLSTLCKVVTERVDDIRTVIDYVERPSKSKADGLSAKDKETFELRETWAAMAQMVPRVSKNRAKELVRTPQFSCLRATFDRLNDEALPAAERMVLLQSSFGKGKREVLHVKLSTNVYHSLTATDPNKTLA